jgi:hypothetical protein
MSQNKIQVTLTRGGREVRRRSFSLEEARSSVFGNLLNEEGVTSGLGNQFEVYVRSLEGENEVSAHNQEEASLEKVLLAASEDGEITGKTFIIDCTAEHRGAGEKGR